MPTDSIEKLELCYQLPPNLNTGNINETLEMVVPQIVITHIPVRSLTRSEVI